MNPANFRLAFGLLCIAALLAVAIGALLEIARARRAVLGGDATVETSTLVSRNQFRLRMLSAVVWMIVLASLAYATLMLWPAPGDSVTARRFVAVVSGALLLILIGLFLLAYDMWLVGRQRRLQEKQFERQLNDLAQSEIERLEIQRLEIERLAAQRPDASAAPSQSTSLPRDSSSS